MSELAIFGGPRGIAKDWPAWPSAGRRERELLDEVLSSAMWGATGFGPKIKEWNEKFAALCGAKAAAAVANGTVSMELCYRAWGVGPGDEVIVPAFTFAATALAAHNAGATAVYVDIDPKTLNIDPARIVEAVTGKTRAIAAVHLAGHPCDMDPILEIARRNDLHVIEDAAQAALAVYKGRRVGAIGDAGSFSLQQSKTIQSGEGGMVVSNDTELIDRIHFSLTKFGRGLRDNYCGHIHYSVGSNLCYTELQAAVALAQLERLEEQTEIRRRNARLLYDLLEDTPGLVPLKPQSYCDVHGLHAFVMLFDSKQFEGAGRAQFLAAMHAEGAPAMSWYPMPLYQQPMYRNEPSLRERHFDCPVVETAARQACFFENNILLAEREQIERLAEIVKKVRTHASQLRNIQIDEKKHMGSAVLAGARERAAAP